MNNRYFLIKKGHQCTCRNYSARDQEYNIYGMVKETTIERDKFYTIDYSFFKGTPNELDYLDDLKMIEIPETEFENREVFEITPIFPLICESKISRWVRYNTNKVIMISMVLGYLSSTVIVSFLLIYGEQWLRNHLFTYFSIFISLVVTFFVSLKAAEVFIAKTLKRFSDTHWLSLHKK